MRLYLNLLLLFKIACFSQNAALQIRIDSITFRDLNQKEREFTIAYHLQNLTNKPVSFILDAKSLQSNATSSMSYSPAYRLYQEEEIINSDTFFNAKIASEKFEETIKKLEQIAQSENNSETIIEIQKQLEENVINSIVKLNPKEAKNFTATLNWDKNRYNQYADNEYYLDEKASHYFDLSINLMKDEFKERASTEDYKKIIEDQTIIKGSFFSNKMRINFNE
jgi:hypothetical protein